MARAELAPTGQTRRVVSLRIRRRRIPPRGSTARHHHHDLLLHLQQSRHVRRRSWVLGRRSAAGSLVPSDGAQTRALGRGGLSRGRRVDHVRAVRILAPFSAWVVAALPSAAPARAQPTTAHEAQALFTEGTTLLARGDPKRALEKLQAAYALLPDALILPNLAQAALELRRHVVAAEACAEYLARSDAPDEYRAAVRKILDQARPHVGELELIARPASATVTVDGAPVPPHRRSSVFVEPGEHAIVLSKGLRARSATVAVSKGGREKVRLALPALVPPPEIAAGSPAGWDRQDPPDGDESPAADAGLSGGSSTGHWLLGGGVAGLVIGAVSYSGYRSNLSQLEDRCIAGYCPSSEADTIDAAEFLGTVSAAGFVLGAIGLGAGVIVLASGDGPADPAAAAGLRVRALVGTRVASAVATVGF